MLCMTAHNRLHLQRYWQRSSTIEKLTFVQYIFIFVIWIYDQYILRTYETFSENFGILEVAKSFFFFKWGEERLKTALQYINMRICFLISQGNSEVNDTFWAQVKKEQVWFECFDQNLLGYLIVHHESSVM